MKLIPALVSVVMLALSALADEKAPRIQAIGSDTVDFGPYPARERKVARYTIRNTGSAPLKILQIRKNCGCASATIDKQELKPKEEARIEVAVLPNSIFGPYTKNAWVESSDPRNPLLQLTVSGTAIPLVEITPTDYFYAGRIPTNSSWSQSFELEATEEGVRLGALTTESNLPVEAAMNRDEQDGRYQLTVRLLPTSESCDLRCNISIPVLEPTNLPPIRISIAGAVGAELYAVPGVFKLPLVDEPATQHFALRVLGQDARVLDPASLKLPRQDGVSFQVEQEEAGRGLQVTATFGPEFIKQLHAHENILFTFEMPGLSSAEVVCKPKK